MGGADASRGFLIQTMIAVLGSLSDKEWVCLTIEPDEPSEKIDIRWEYPNKSVATQIKSSDNQITLSNAKKWAELLKTGEADEYNLILVGSCAQSVTDLGNYDGVEIPNPLPNNSGGLLDQASYLLSSFLERESFDPLPATSVKSIAKQLIAEFFIKVTEPISRSDLLSLIKESISDTGYALRTDAALIAKQFIESNKRQSETIELQEEQIRALAKTIEELEAKGKSDPVYDAALKAMNQGDSTLATSLFEKNIQASEKEQESSYINIGTLNFFTNPEKSINAFSNAVVLNPSNKDSWQQLGILKLRTGDFSAAIDAFDKYRELAVDDGDKIVALGYTGNILLNAGKLKEAMGYFDSVLGLVVIDDSRQRTFAAQAHGSLAKVYFALGAHQKCIEHADEALKLFSEDNLIGIANQLSIKGAVYIETDLFRAERYSREALRIFKEISAPEYVAYTLNNIGAICGKHNEEKAAVDCYNEALAIHTAMNNKSSMATTIMNIGNLYMRSDTDKSLDMYCRALTIVMDLALTGKISEVVANMAGAHRARGEKERACDLYGYALKLSKDSGRRHLEKKINGFMRGYCID